MHKRVNKSEINFPNVARMNTRANGTTDIKSIPLPFCIMQGANSINLNTNFTKQQN